MGVFYWFFNLLLPLGLLIWQSLRKFNLTQQIPFEKWALLIISVYLFNFITSIWDESIFLFLIDLIIKIAITFIPDKINQQIQDTITNLHLQIWLDQLRCWLITAFQKHYWKLTQYLLSKMEYHQTQQFKQTLIHQLKSQSSPHFISKPIRHFTNTAINCDKLTDDIASNLSSTAKILEQYSRKIVSERTLHNQTFGQIQSKTKTTNTEQNQFQSKKEQFQYTTQQFPKFNYKKKDLQVLSKQPNLRLKQSRQLLDQQEYQDKVIPQPISPIYNKKQATQPHVVFKTVGRKFQQYQTNEPQTKKVKQEQRSQFKRTYTFTDYTSSEIASHSDRFQKLYREDGQAFTDELVNKLDISSSEYSDMFDENDQDLRTLECKVEVILEIGTGTSARLQIYNLELYSNSDLRIVSLYQREFQSHKLREIKALPNGYFELIFEEGKIHSRKCKFRGQHQPFLKYMQK